MENYSVLMSVYYKEKPEFLRESIQSMLDQTVPTNDFVIVCDGPLTPELDTVIEEYVQEIPAIFQIVRLDKNMGLGSALNQGLLYCQNEIVARMDSDDISVPDRCEKQLEILLYRKLDIVSGTISEFSDDPNFITCKRALPDEHEKILKFAHTRCPFNHPCVMYRKSAVIAAGSYHHFYLFEDYYLWVRMLMNGSEGYNIPNTILFMRTNGQSMYLRRGGIKYMCSTLKFKCLLKRIGFTNWSEFFYSVFTHTIVCLIPNRARVFIYKIFLRE